VKNLCTFLCQDVDQTPTFAYLRALTDGILSFQVAGASRPKPTKEANGNAGSEKVHEARKAQLARRGAGQAFHQLSAKFGAKLLDVVPSMWQSMAGGLLSACQVGMCVYTLTRLEVYH
jgi:TATA-binding protein-associated factor